MGLFKRDFEIKNGTLVRYNGKGGAVLVPEGVTHIGEKAFAERKKVTSVCLPEGLRSIQRQAFHHCTALTDVNIPKSVTEIGEYAFAGCLALDGIVLPQGLTQIANGCFFFCESLQKIFIPNSVTSIGTAAFEWCSTLVQMDLTAGLQEIGKRAFECCKSLLRISIPSTVTKVDADAFRGCPSLDLTIHEGLKYLGSMYNPYHLLVSVVDHNITACKLHPDTKIIASRAFWDCDALKSIELPSGLLAIGEQAFGCCPRLWDLHIPNSVCDIASDLGACESFAIHAYIGSYAEAYAKRCGITYHPLYDVPNA